MLNAYPVHVLQMIPTLTDNNVKLTFINVLPIVCQCLSKEPFLFFSFVVHVLLLLEFRQLELETEVLVKRTQHLFSIRGQRSRC